MRNRQSSTISNDDGRIEGTGRVEVTGRGGHVVAGTSVQEPLGGAGWLCGDAGVVQRGVEGLLIPRGGARLLALLMRLMHGRHSLLWLERWSWAEDARSWGPERHGPGLDHTGPRIIASGPRSGRLGGLLVLTTAAAAARSRSAGGRTVAPAFLLVLVPGA